MGKKCILGKYLANVFTLPTLNIYFLYIKDNTVICSNCTCLYMIYHLDLRLLNPQDKNTPGDIVVEGLKLPGELDDTNRDLDVNTS